MPHLTLYDFLLDILQDYEGILYLNAVETMASFIVLSLYRNQIARKGHKN